MSVKGIVRSIGQRCPLCGEELGDGVALESKEHDGRTLQTRVPIDLYGEPHGDAACLRRIALKNHALGPAGRGREMTDAELIARQWKAIVAQSTLLATLQWRREDGGMSCPVCRWMQADGHDSHCALAAALAEAKAVLAEKEGGK